MSERWPAVALSVLLHAALLAGLLYGWLLYRRPPRPAPTLAIEATVVDARTLVGAPPAPRAANPPVAPAPPSPPPQPQAEDQARRERQHEVQAEADRAREEAVKQQAAREEAARQQAQREAAQREATQREAARKAQAEADARKRAQEEARQRALEEQQRREDEAALRHRIASEEQAAAAARAGPALASWQAAIAARVTRAWIRPPTARPGIECRLNVTQVPGGEVVGVQIVSCNGDQAVRESIEAAVYRASPLPPPPDPALFDRNLIINFKPD